MLFFKVMVLKHNFQTYLLRICSEIMFSTHDFMKKYILVKLCRAPDKDRLVHHCRSEKPHIPSIQLLFIVGIEINYVSGLGIVRPKL